MTAKQIIELLRTRHESRHDVFVVEAGTGWHYDPDFGRLDAWAMRRSWTRSMSWGYEVKVTHQDFVGDNKWDKYPPMCHEFYFVAPHGVIAVDEVPDEAGLILVSKTGSRLYTKKKAPTRSIDPPTDFYYALLVNQAKFGDDHKRLSHGRNVRDWQAWVEGRAKLQDIGRKASRKLREEISTRLSAADDKVAKLKKRVEGLEVVERTCKQLGVDPERTWDLDRKLRGALDRLRGQGVVDHVDAAIQALEQVKAEIDGEPTDG